MTYSAVYLKFVETRTEGAEDVEAAVDPEIEDDDWDSDYDGGAIEGDKTFIEFHPLRLTATQRSDESLELELDFEAKLGAVLHLVVVRFNTYAYNTFDDWCIEGVFATAEEAEDKAEAIEDGAAAASCTDPKPGDHTILKAEVFSLTLQAK